VSYASLFSSCWFVPRRCAASDAHGCDRRGGVGAAEAGGGSTTGTDPHLLPGANVNRSKVACAADGRTYTERGDLVLPARGLSGASRAHTVTLYLHGLGLGEFFWNFKAVAGYDYADALAADGQASVVIDRLGYDSSGKPAGKQLCLGSQADIVHQEIVDLRDGHYTLAGHQPARFSRVVLAGHSFGGLIAQIEAYSFGGINGLVVMSYATRTPPPSTRNWPPTGPLPARRPPGTTPPTVLTGQDRSVMSATGRPPWSAQRSSTMWPRPFSPPPNRCSTTTPAATPSPSPRR